MGLHGDGLQRVHRQFLRLRPVRSGQAIRILSRSPRRYLRAGDPGRGPAHHLFRQLGGVASPHDAVVAAAVLRGEGAGRLGLPNLGADRHRARCRKWRPGQQLHGHGRQTGRRRHRSGRFDQHLSFRECAADGAIRFAPARAEHRSGAGTVRPAVHTRRKTAADSKMKLRVILVAGLGLGLAVYLIGYVGFGAVISAALAIGWSGFAILCGYALLLFVILGAAWYVLIPGAAPARLRTFIWSRMVRDSAGEVLPFSQVGGFVIGARAAILRGVNSRLAFASTIVDVTTEMLAQLAYVGLGIALLAERAPKTPFTASLTEILIAGLVIAGIAGGIFLFLQRHGVGTIGKLV